MIQLNNISKIYNKGKANAFQALYDVNLMYRELAGGDGFADLVFVPRKNCNTPALIVELKWNKSAEMR